MSSHYRPNFISPSYALFVLAFSQMVLADQASHSANAQTGSNQAKAAYAAAKELVDLMATRLELAESVAKSKWKERLVVENEKADAMSFDANLIKESGLDPAFMESFAKSQVATFKERQRQWFAAWKSSGVDGFDEVPDLALSVRPQLDRNCRDQAKQLGILKPALCSADMIKVLNDMASETFSKRSLNKTFLEASFKPFDVHAREESGSCPVASAR